MTTGFKVRPFMNQEPKSRCFDAVLIILNHLTPVGFYRFSSPLSYILWKFLWKDFFQNFHEYRKRKDQLRWLPSQGLDNPHFSLTSLHLVENR